MISSFLSNKTLSVNVKWLLLSETVIWLIWLHNLNGLIPIVSNPLPIETLVNEVHDSKAVSSIVVIESESVNSCNPVDLNEFFLIWVIN